MPTYTGNESDETLAGSSGADTLIGLGGNDVYTVDHLGDVVVETSEPGSGIDTIRTSVLDVLATYSLAWWQNVENLTYTGSATASILKGNALYNVIMANEAVVASDTLHGGEGNDTLFGYGGDDSLMGGSGDDVIDGGTGTDMMIGGTGNDRYFINVSTDRVFEYRDGGFDTIVSSVAKDLRVSWAAQVEGLSYVGSTAATLYGNAQGNRIESTSATNEIIWGYGGSDTLDGGAGIDTMRGGLGDDFFLVSAADVVVEIVGEGTDTFVGDKTSIGVAAYATTIENIFYTGATGAIVTGNAMANLASGGAGNDTVRGNDGNDTLLGGAGADTVQGGLGDDVLYGGSNLDWVWVPGRPLLADAEIDRLEGGAGDDRYLIDDLQDVVVEVLTGGTRDVVISTVDNSLARYANVEALVLQGGSDAWYAQGSARNDILVGNEGDNYIVGGDGNDILSANVDAANVLGPQIDVLEGKAGNDVLVAFDFGVSHPFTREVSLFGGIGDDLYVIGTTSGAVGGRDAGGFDTAVLTSSGALDLLEGVESIYLWGAFATQDLLARNAINAVFAAANNAPAYTGTFGNAHDATGNDLANSIFGNALDNHLIGGAGNDTITGGIGNDTLEGGSGTDSLVGGTGDDWYYLDTGDVAVELPGQGFDVLASETISTNAAFSAYANFEGWQYLGTSAVNLHRDTTNTTNDYLGGGSGNDTLSGYGGNDTLDGGAGNDLLNGGTGLDSLRGGLGDDNLYGGDYSDALEGGDGGDQLFGELGDDSLLGEAGNDWLDGGGNWDALDGGDGDDSLFGGDGNDQLEGGTGDDLLTGEAQNDRLVGGAGSDMLYGGGVTAEGSNTSAGDHLWGDEEFGMGGLNADIFAFDALSYDNVVRETFNGSGEFVFVAGATIGDFEAGIDTISVTKDYVGNYDTVIDGVDVQTSAGGTFSSSDELVLVRADVADTFVFSRASFFDPISAAALDSVIGDADAAIGVNETRLFVVDDGANSALLLFYSSDGNAAVTMDELFLLGVVTGQSELGASDFGLF
jgi:Ca2+-binding RTX toxin-like protein